MLSVGPTKRKCELTMQDELQAFYQQVNHTRFRGQIQGHYESFFLRANHPTRPLAFWIRYTIVQSQALPENALGELWAFSSMAKPTSSRRQQEYRIGRLPFDTSAFRVQTAGKARPAVSPSAIESKGQRWVELTFESDSLPILLLPFSCTRSFPAAKKLGQLADCRFSGQVSVNGDRLMLQTGWGARSQLGVRHTNLYAWAKSRCSILIQRFSGVATAKLR